MKTSNKLYNQVFFKNRGLIEGEISGEVSGKAMIQIMSRVGDKAWLQTQAHILDQVRDEEQ
jgi:hypothetical protein